ncbi:MAG: helix-turn-helix domain-containing protein [Clostridia bacterium]|nr:helix-turn-helix domain-containing protein [Clostridia bacterium]
MKQKELRERIRSKHITEASLAEMLGITKWTMSRKMHGYEDFTWSEVLQMCEILGIENPIGVIHAKTERTRCR